MKLTAKDQKAQIKWFAVLHDGSKMRNSRGFQHNAWEAQCSCGWETHTGGAIKAYIKKEIKAHKWSAHHYAWELSK